MVVVQPAGSERAHRCREPFGGPCDALIVGRLRRLSERAGRGCGPPVTASMSSSAKLLEDALHLEESERALLAGALIESLHGPAEIGAEDAWERVIERRVREFEAGTAETIRWSAVRARLVSGYG